MWFGVHKLTTNDTSCHWQHKTLQQRIIYIIHRGRLTIAHFSQHPKIRSQYEVCPSIFIRYNSTLSNA